MAFVDDGRRFYQWDYEASRSFQNCRVTSEFPANAVAQGRTARMSDNSCRKGSWRGRNSRSHVTEALLVMWIGKASRALIDVTPADVAGCRSTYRQLDLRCIMLFSPTVRLAWRETQDSRVKAQSVTRMQQARCTVLTAYQLGRTSGVCFSSHGGLVLKPGRWAERSNSSGKKDKPDMSSTENKGLCSSCIHVSCPTT